MSNPTPSQFHDSVHAPAFGTPRAVGSPIVKKALDMSRAGAITDQNRLHIALEMAVGADPSIKDVMVQEGQELWVSCARGRVRLSDVIEPKTAPELFVPITKPAIFYFVVLHLMGSDSHEQAAANNAKLNEHMALHNSYSDSIRLTWGSKIRISLYRQNREKLALACRTTSLLIPSLDQSGLPHQAVSAIKNIPRGLVLLTGPMSSGKTSVAQSILQHRNMTTPGHIMTVEDPIETQLTPEKCLITPKEVGVDVTSFEEGLRDALRQAVDVLFIGEVRNAETVRTALSAATAGMLVIATFHADSISMALNRMMTMLGAEAPAAWKTLSSCLITATRQALVPTAAADNWIVVADALINNGKGPLASVLESGDSSKLNQFASGASRENDGWISMNDRLKQQVDKKMITIEAARRETTDVKDLVASFTRK